MKETNTSGPSTELARYLANAPAPAELDELEARAARGDIKTIRQEAPGVYTFVVGPNQLAQWGGR